MSMKNITRLIKTAMFTPTRNGWGMPLLLWGKPGIGKSDVIEGIALEHGLPLEVLSPGERGEGAFGVTPMPDSDGYISYPPPRWSEQFQTAENGFLFLDEINLAPPAIQAPMLGLLIKRRIGGATLPPGVRMIGAANDVADAAGGWDLAPPMANRLGHLAWEAPSEDEWTEWLMSAADEKAEVGESVASIEKRVQAAWNPEWSAARGVVAGFIRAKPAALHKQPPAGHPDASKAWPSHRSWESATRALASARVHGLDEAAADLFAGAFVGHGIVGELAEYRASADLPNPGDVLSGKVKFAPDFKRLDRTFAVVGSTTAMLKHEIEEAGGAPKASKNPAVMKRFAVFVELLHRVADKAVDLTWPGAKMIAKAHMHEASTESKTIMRRLMPMINATEGR